MVNTTHRDPPKPVGWDTPTKGTCRFCGLPVLNEDGTVNYRTYWHPICVVDYKMIFWPGVTRQAVFMRDGGKCATCGHRCSTRGSDVWHLDHIQPLVENRGVGDIEYWKMGNLQTLCQPCHHAKTSREATERAASRKAAKEAEKAGVTLDPTLFVVPSKQDDEQVTKIRDRIFEKDQRKRTRPPRGKRRR